MSDDACAGPSEDAEAAATAVRSGARLVLISTPIGNLGDISRRASEALGAADLLLCEDTRTAARLLSALGISVHTTALHEHNEDAMIPRLLRRMEAGETLALVTDAGTPLVSDPGFRLVRAAIAAGHAVTAIPGPNAALTALVLSGLPPQPFMFLGFPPPRTTARLSSFRRLRTAEAAGLKATLIWHEAPHRLTEMLDDLADVFGGRDAAVARELTKRFEEVVRATPAALAAHFRERAARGEITVLLGPPYGKPEVDEASLDAALLDALRTMRVKEAAIAIAAATGLPRRVVYARALALGR